MPKILGERFRKARENLGLSVEDLAKRTTFSKQQIQQIEEGGHSAFYSPAIKYQSAKKVADILGLDHEAVFEMSKAIPAIHPETMAQLKPQTLESAPKILEPKKKVSSSPIAKTKTKAKPSRAKSWMLWGISAASLLGVGWVFFAPMLEADEVAVVVQTSEPSSAQNQEAAQPESTIATSPSQPDLGQTSTSSVASLNNSNPASCTLSAPATSSIVQYLPPKASKAGNQVYVLNKGDPQTICFEDALGSGQQITVVSGEGFNFAGKPPIKIISKNLNQLDIYYQGYKVKSDVLGQAILLQEAQIQ